MDWTMHGLDLIMNSLIDCKKRTVIEHLILQIQMNQL